MVQLTPLEAGIRRVREAARAQELPRSDLAMSDTLREARRVACTMTFKMNSIRGLS